MEATTQTADYSGHTIHFGLDYHKKSWAIHPVHGKVSGKAYTIVNPTAMELHRRLQLTYPNATFLGVYEAGFGGYGLIRQLQEYKVELHAVHAADVPQTDKERQLKNDPSDAFRLAKMARSGDYESLYVPSIKEEGFRQMVRRRTDLVKSTTRVQNKIKGHLVFRNRVPEEFRFEEWRLSKRNVLKLERLAHQTQQDEDMEDHLLLSLIGELRGFRREVLDVTRTLRKIVQVQNADLYERLLGCPGVGPITAMTLIGELFNMERFSNFDKLCSYVGLIPRSKSSGERELNGQMVSRGNKRLRTILVEASWQAKGSDPALGLFYHRLVTEENMKANLAILKVASKLLSRIRYIWTSGDEYRNNIG
jgi:transposase